MSTPRLSAPFIVYFAQCGGGRIKIGSTTNVVARVHTLNGSCPAPVRLLGIITGNTATGIDRFKPEFTIHNRFRHLKAYGEWFEPADDLLAFIEAHAEPVMIDLTRMGPRKRPQGPRDWIAREPNITAGGRALVQAAIDHGLHVIHLGPEAGISAPVVQNAVRGVTKPSAAALEKLNARFGLSLTRDDFARAA